VPTQYELREELTRAILDGIYSEGSYVPSTREVSKRTGAHCQTIAKAYRPLLDAAILEKRPGFGIVVTAGARQTLMAIERRRFLSEEWPQIQRVIESLELSAEAIALLSNKSPQQRSKS
jgi:GntR family transcriptional regulator